VSEEKKVKGHHGNEIRTVTLKLSNRNTMQRFLEHFWRQLSTLDREQILSLLPQLVDEKNVLHLRLDKQELFLGNPRLGGEDPVKIEIGFNWLPKPQLEKIEHLKMLFIQLDEHMRV
jgi:RNA binding exosome subunit